MTDHTITIPVPDGMTPEELEAAIHTAGDAILQLGKIELALTRIGMPDVDTLIAEWKRLSGIAV